MEGASYFVPKTITRILNPSLPENENIEKSYEEKSDIDLERQKIEKVIIPSNIIDIYTRLEVLLDIKLSGHCDTQTEASNLIDEIYKGGDLKKTTFIKCSL